MESSHTYSFLHNFLYSILEQCEGKNKITMLNIVCSKLGIVYLTLLEKVQILRREYLFQFSRKPSANSYSWFLILPNLQQRINFSYIFFLFFRRLQNALLQDVYDQEISELHIGDNEKSSSEVKSDEKIEIMNPFNPEDIP